MKLGPGDHVEAWIWVDHHGLRRRGVVVRSDNNTCLVEFRDPLEGMWIATIGETPRRRWVQMAGVRRISLLDLMAEAAL